MRSYFIFNDIDSRSLDIKLKAAPPIMRAKERVTQVTVPGRSGSLTQSEGEGGVYEGYTQTITARVSGAAVRRGALSALSGEGYVTFSTDEGRRQKCRLINAITLNKLSYNLDWYEGSLYFYCEPLKELLHEPTDVIVSSGSVLKNLGDVPERPVIRVYGSGDFALTVNGSVFTLTGLTAGAIIDTDAGEVTDLAGENLITNLSMGAFPILKVGSNKLSWAGAGVTNVHVQRRQRWL